MNQSIRSFIENFDAGKYDSNRREIQIDAGWYDWFCRDNALRNKTYKLAKKVKQLAESPLVDKDNLYVFFKNNCPMQGNLYDDFRFCDMKSGNVIFTIVPSSGFTYKRGKAELWGKQNDFQKPLVEGTWNDIKNFFKV